MSGINCNRKRQYLSTLSLPEGIPEPVYPYLSWVLPRKETMSASLFGDSDHCLFSYPVTPPSRWTNLDNGNGSFSRHTLLALSPRQTLRNNEKPRPIRKPHPAAPSLCSMTDPLSEPTNRLIKTDVVALLNHGEHEREVYARHSMDAQQDAINRILDGVESIQDVDRNIIVELRGVMAGTMPIEKFLVGFQIVLTSPCLIPSPRSHPPSLHPGNCNTSWVALSIIANCKDLSSKPRMAMCMEPQSMSSRMTVSLK